MAPARDNIIRSVDIKTATTGPAYEVEHLRSRDLSSVIGLPLSLDG